MNFSLYRGNLHKVPDVPRRWYIPKPTMTLEVFQRAIAKREEALRRFSCLASIPEITAEDGKNNNTKDTKSVPQEEARESRKRGREDSLESVIDRTGRLREKSSRLDSSTEAEAMSVDGNEGLDKMDCDHKSPKHDVYSEANDNKLREMADADCNMACLESKEAVQHDESTKLLGQVEHVTPSSDEFAVEVVKAIRKAELEEKLKQLQEAKHQLVQILKQVLISEEKSKKRAQITPQASSMPYSTIGATEQILERPTLEPVDLEDGELEYPHTSAGPVPDLIGHGVGTVVLGRYPSASQYPNKAKT